MMEEEENINTSSIVVEVILPSENLENSQSNVELIRNTADDEEVITQQEQEQQSEMQETNSISYLKLNFDKSLENQGSVVLKSRKGEFGFSKDEIPIYTKGIKWSPDGLCILSNSNDNIVRLFELPQELLGRNFSEPANFSHIEWSPCLTVKEGGCINDFCWHPLMSSSTSSFCNFLTVSTKQPVHMWDAFNGNLLNSFMVRDKMGETDNIISVSYNGKLSQGNKIYCGLDQRICVFDAQAGSSSGYSEIHSMEKQSIRGSGSKKKTKRFGQTGFISCFDFNPIEESIFVAGCYNNTIGIYDQNLDSVQHIIECEFGTGVNCVKFSSDGNYLLVSSRKSDKVVCWDLRNMFEPVKIFDCSRNFNTNQKVNFDTDTFTQFTCAGTCDGKIKVFDMVNSGVESVELNATAPNQVINSVNLHPYLPYIAFSTGERKYKRVYSNDAMSDDEDDSSDDEEVFTENFIGLWEIPNFSYFTC